MDTTRDQNTAHGLALIACEGARRCTRFGVQVQLRAVQVLIETISRDWLQVFLLSLFHGERECVGQADILRKTEFDGDIVDGNTYKFSETAQKMEFNGRTKLDSRLAAPALRGQFCGLVDRIVRDKDKRRQSVSGPGRVITLLREHPK
ncbi:hypothetical protein POJ06DRAFT_272144 [Lipomyces tetrasporus]|uniref:Uncharacterized protein n=1 Tax=Lipomyces tetrasporus TaxID=54092 RepID=A0AAD7QY04_9ASCO|nr:uncharacterized protein POJ06DRAFT_272144 [Lipomyces tetrasporus]KAJ8103411.1 hypothetical protein POJ06DRAFT_272144 [Lipomyces tetrasporus]